MLSEDDDDNEDYDSVDTEAPSPSSSPPPNNGGSGAAETVWERVYASRARQEGPMSAQAPATGQYIHAETDAARKQREAAEAARAREATFDTIYDNRTIFDVHNPAPIPCERAGGSLMPENAYDIDTVVDNIERSKRALHDRRTKSLFWRFLRSVARAGLISEYWQAVPAHEAHPRYVLYIENNWKTWLWWLSACASLAWWGWWMLGNVLNSKTVVLHDGALIENMWTASSTRVYDLGSTDVAKWIASRRHEMRRIEPGAEYLSAPVLEAGESRNVTVKWLDAALTAHCYTEEEEERRGGGGEWPWSAPSVVTVACPCMAAVEVGVLANVVLAPGTGLLFNPRISAESKLRTLVRFEEDDETEADMPVSIFVDFTRRDGMSDRMWFDLEQAFCVLRSIALLHQTP